MKNYYHAFANGDESRNFIISEKDYSFEFNLIGICAANSAAKVLAFSLEDSHPHFLLYGEHSDCASFLSHFEYSSKKHISGTRGRLERVKLAFQMYLADSDDYLRNVASYVCVQATKDGKKIMPYDYFWGTGSMYFRGPKHIPIWCITDNGKVIEPTQYSSLCYEEKRRITNGKDVIPADWLVCNGLILPCNYVDVNRFENIFKSHNCFRVFMSSGRNKLQEVSQKMAHVKGVDLEDLEARNISKTLCQELFGRQDVRTFRPDERLLLASELRKRFGLSWRQISTLSRLPESELRQYL